MLGDTNQTPASARPKYGLEAQSGQQSTGSAPKKAILLALFALASSLVLVIPDNDGEVYALNAASDAEASDGVGAAAEAAIGADGTTTSSLLAVAGETGESSAADRARLALATEAALSGAEHSQQEGSAILSFADELNAARAAAAAFAETETPTTEPPAAPTTARPTTTARAAPTTTVPPATTVDSTADPEATTAGDGSDSTATDETAVPESSTAESDTLTTEPATTETASGANEAPETTVPETTVPETTVPETTVPETTAAADGFVDSGNGVMLPAVLIAIRYCESRDNYTAANPSSSARGAYQFLTGSWAGYGHKDRYGVNQAHLATPAQQDEAAKLTWERDGTRPWNASKSCWSARI